MQKTNREVEVKLAVQNLPALLAKLRRMKARQLACVHERNELYDTPARDLQHQGAVLRIRRETPAHPPPAKRPRARRRSQGAVGGILTYKGLVPDEGGKSEKYKIREEIEYRLGNAKRMGRILMRMGLRPWFRYEKYRTKFRLRQLPALHIDLDETPIGVYLELEGSRLGIDRAAKALGYTPDDYMAVSYLELFAAKTLRKGKNPVNMLFR